MIRLDWSRKNLSDERLDADLQQLGADVLVGILCLSNNMLTFVPALVQYKQLKLLKVLKLDDNNITTITMNNIPLSCESLCLNGNQIIDLSGLRTLPQLKGLFLCNNNIDHLDLSQLPPSLTDLGLANNKLTSVPDLRHCENLSSLALDGNNISDVTVTHLPLSITWLSVMSNSLREVPDLSHLPKLSKLWLRRNPIKTITGLPNSLTDLLIDKKVRVLGEKCCSENTYKILKDTLHTRSLVQPPAKVFRKGLSHMRSYYEKKPYKRFARVKRAYNIGIIGARM